MSLYYIQAPKTAIDLRQVSIGNDEIDRWATIDVAFLQPSKLIRKPVIRGSAMSSRLAVLI